MLAYGRDPSFDGWPDTLQLNYGNPKLQEAMIGELETIEDEDVSRKAVGVQIDAGLDDKDHYISPAEASLWRDFTAAAVVRLALNDERKRTIRKGEPYVLREEDKHWVGGTIDHRRRRGAETDCISGKKSDDTTAVER
jgi:hypothetical protein